MINVLLIAAFFVLLWLPVADALLHFDPSPAPNEKRTPAGFPTWKFSAAGVRDYFAGLERYYSDHFGFRKTLLRWEHKWKRSLFRESSVTEAMIGRDGWLFLARGGMVDNMLGNLQFTEPQLQDWKQVFQTRRDWCAQRGIAYQLVIAPEKHSIYPEHLPAWITGTRRTDQIGQLVAYLQTNATVPVLDLRGVLLAAKATNQVFHVTDTHWNDWGAFVGYEALLNALAVQRPGLQPLPLAAFAVRHAEQPGGDLAIMLAQEETLRETNHIAFEPQPPLVAIAARLKTNLAAAGQANGPVYVTENAAAKGKVVVFHDSFAVALQPFLGQHFGEMIYVWQHDWDLALLEQQRPDVVIDEIAERAFYRGEPRKWK